MNVVDLDVWQGMMTAREIVFSLVPMLCCFFAARVLLHYFQLESYQFPGYFRTLNRNRKHAFLPGICSAAVCLILFTLQNAWYTHALQSPETPPSAVMIWLITLGLLTVAVLAGIGIGKVFSEKHAKKAFVFTGRMRRLMVMLALVLAALGWLFQRTVVVWNLLFLWPLFLPLVVALAGLLAWPIEKAISELYFRDARRKLLSIPGLIRIGITGSYGKTSVKHILGTILSEKYTTLITPASFNTPMGVTRTIREKLTPSYQVFVGEMGARHVGDIKEICDMVHPDHGVITSIGPQHLETFFNMENIQKTKFELADALPEGGMLFLNGDNDYIQQQAASPAYDQTPEKIFYYSETEGTGYCAKDVKVSQLGTEFTVVTPDGESERFQMRLIGAHNVINVVGAIAVAHKMGMTLQELRIPVRRIEPVPHRMQMREHGLVTIIDDAYNSNPVGSKAAVETLAMFDGIRILITPGMVELGGNEDGFNRAFGEQMADSVDIRRMRQNREDEGRACWRRDFRKRNAWYSTSWRKLYLTPMPSKGRDISIFY